MPAAGRSKETLALPTLLDRVKTSLLTKTPSSLSTIQKRRYSLLRRTSNGSRRSSLTWPTSSWTRAQSTIRTWLAANGSSWLCWCTSTSNLTCACTARLGKNVWLMSFGEMAAKFHRLCALRSPRWSQKVSKRSRPKATFLRSSKLQS